MTLEGKDAISLFIALTSLVVSCVALAVSWYELRMNSRARIRLSQVKYSEFSSDQNKFGRLAFTFRNCGIELRDLHVVVKFRLSNSNGSWSIGATPSMPKDDPRFDRFPRGTTVAFRVDSTQLDSLFANSARVDPNSARVMLYAWGSLVAEFPLYGVLDQNKIELSKMIWPLRDACIRRGWESLYDFLGALQPETSSFHVKQFVNYIDANSRLVAESLNKCEKHVFVSR